MKGKMLVSIHLVMAAAVAAAVADEGSIPVYQPTTISLPGHYVVTRDITVTSGDVIQIATGNVDLDLNGFTVSSTATTGNMVSIGANLSNITVRNGKLIKGSRGVSGDTARRIRLEGLEIRSSFNQGIYLAGVINAEVISCRLYGTATAPGGGALAALEITGGFFGSTGSVIDTFVETTNVGGIRLNGLSGAEVRGNLVTGAGLACPTCAGFALLSAGPVIDGSRVQGNRFQGNGSYGVILTAPGTLFSGNTVTSNSTCGALITSAGNLILDNVVRYMIDAGDCGLRIEGNFNTLRGNQVSEILTYGIWVTGIGNFIDNNFVNTVNAAGSCGIRFEAGGNTYRNNLLDSNSDTCGVANTNAGGNL